MDIIHLSSQTWAIGLIVIAAAFYLFTIIWDFQVNRVKSRVNKASAGFGHLKPWYFYALLSLSLAGMIPPDLFFFPSVSSYSIPVIGIATVVTAFVLFCRLLGYTRGYDADEERFDTALPFDEFMQIIHLILFIIPGFVLVNELRGVLFGEYVLGDWFFFGGFIIVFFFITSFAANRVVLDKPSPWSVITSPRKTAREINKA